MSAEIITLKNAILGDGAVIEPDVILEGPKTKLREVVVLGIDHEGEIWVSCSHGMRDAVYLLERCKQNLLTAQGRGG